MLSIIITYYNQKIYADELLDCLAPQITDDVEVILVDDGSKIPYETKYKWVNLIRKENGGVSTARNMGLEKAKGEYISFIDADDLVANNYVEQILAKIPFDYLDMSWKSLPHGAQWSRKLNSDKDRLTNPSAVTRAFSRAFIGDIRFNEKKDNAEDEDFTRHVFFGRKANVAVVTDYLYFYRTSVENSNSKKYLNGESNTRRIIYNIPHVTEDMTYLLDECKKEDEVNEVFIMTDQCDIPELGRYAQVIKPQPLHGMELRGEPTSNFLQIDMPLRTQVVVYANTIQIGGIETFIYNFCYRMKDYYDIIVLYESINGSQLSRLRQLVRTERVGRKIVCDTLIMNKLANKPPVNVSYKKKIQMIHTSQRQPVMPCDLSIAVSNVVSRNFDTETVIGNMTIPYARQKALVLVSVTRLAVEKCKGEKNIKDFAKLLRENGVPFIWLLFSDKPLNEEGIINMGVTVNPIPYIRSASYLVQLSTAEAFCYSIVEALSVGTPVITTPLEVLKEYGFKNGEHGFIVPFNIEETDNIKQIATSNLRGFDWHYDNDEKIAKWREILGDTVPKHDYDPSDSKSLVVLRSYNDMKLNCHMKAGTEFVVDTERANVLIELGFCKEI